MVENVVKIDYPTDLNYSNQLLMHYVDPSAYVITQGNSITAASNLYGRTTIIHDWVKITVPLDIDEIAWGMKIRHSGVLFEAMLYTNVIATGTDPCGVKLVLYDEIFGSEVSQLTDVIDPRSLYSYSSMDNFNKHPYELTPNSTVGIVKTDTGGDVAVPINTEIGYTLIFAIDG